jgi:hypothetical protein
MKPTLYLRLASVLTLLHAVLHTVGGVFGQPAPGPQLAAVSAMQSNRFLVMGVERSYWHFYRGMGLAVSIFLFMGAIVFWQLSTLAQTTGIDASRLRPILTMLLASYLAMSLCSWKYFFAPPVIVELLIAFCVGLALLASPNPNQQPQALSKAA